MTGDTGVFQLPDAGRARRRRARRPHVGHDGHARAGRAHLRQLRANARGLAQAMRLGDDERWLCPLPLAHVGGLMVFLRSAIMATTAVLAPPPFDAEAVARHAARRRHHDRLARARRSCSGCSTPAPTPGPELRARAARRRRDAAGAARARPRRRLPGLPELRAHRRRARRSPSPSPATWRPPGARCTGVGVAIADDGEILVSGATVNALGSLRTGDLGRLDERGPPRRHRPQGAT